ncbi:alanine racemase, partial [bacterium]|nr:alanine racemase [bacterium]
MEETWPSWLEVRLDHIVNNVREIKKLIGPGVRMLAVVKANGYGHGALAVSLAAIRGGADLLGVGSPQEGIELRKGGISNDILVLGGCLADQVTPVSEFDFIQGVQNIELLLELEREGQRSGKPIRVHLKVDTGMGRLGFGLEEIKNIYSTISKMKYIKVEGIFSHLATADAENPSFSQVQINRFQRLKEDLGQKGAGTLLWHICNSGGMLNFPEARYDMVRCGLAMYGMFPSEMENDLLDLKLSLSWKSRIVSLKTIHRGESVSYGRKWIAERDELIGVVPLGYHDGYSRQMSSVGEVLLKEGRAKVVGAVCMDNLMISVTDIPGVLLGDEVLLLGSLGN